MKIISVFGTVSGVGTSTVAANLAAMLAIEFKTIILDVSSGTGVITALGATEKMQAGVYADITSWTDHEIFQNNGLAVLPSDEQSVHNEQMQYFQEFIAASNEQYQYIVMDLGELQAGVKPLIQQSDYALMITEPNPRCLVKKHLVDERFTLIVNKASSNVYHPRDIARWFERDEYFEVPEDISIARKSLQMRIPMICCGGKRYTTSISSIVQYVVGVETTNIHMQKILSKPFQLLHKHEELQRKMVAGKQEVANLFNKPPGDVIRNIPSISVPKLKFKTKRNEGESEQIALQEAPQQIPSYNPTAITAGGLFAVVSPWRPALAGRVAGLIVELLSGSGEEVAVFGASGHSTVSVWLDIPEPELFMSDWRVPGSQVPVLLQNIKVWATDPAKALHMDIEKELWRNINDARKTATYTVIDFAGDFELAQKAAFKEQSLVLVIVPGEDPEQKITLLWLNRVIKGREKQNIITAIDLRGVNAKETSNFTHNLIISDFEEETKATLVRDLKELLQGGKQ